MNSTKWAALTLALVGIAAITRSATAGALSIPLLCSRGPSGQRFEVRVTMPSRAEIGSTYSVRLDGVSSGKISQLGLHYIHDMTVDYVMPGAGSYVEGSAQVVAGTGTSNVQGTPRLSYRAGVITMVLPGKVEDGTSFTPPSLELRLRAVGPPGSAAAVSFSQYRLTANAFLIGDVAISCDPAPKPCPIGETVITASPGDK